MKFYVIKEKLYYLVTKIPLTMRLLVLSLFLSIGVTLANHTYAQSTKISIHFQNETIAGVLEAVESQTDFTFVYDSKAVDTKRKVSVQADKENIFDVLTQMFSGSDIAYTVINKKIILNKIEEMMNLTQQGITITGTVTDENGEPMPGVNVLVKGSMQGGVTDVNGKYTINVPGKDAVLVFSFIGYTSTENTVGEQRIINIVMHEDLKEIEEVVVVGYGTTRKSDLTGAISSVNKDQIKERSSSNVLTSLSGQVAGVQIQQTQGAPGMAPTIKIRGVATITAGATPLYVIDGIPMEDNSGSYNNTGGAGSYFSGGGNQQNPLSMINPADIESIEILKDASSAAIYGSRGANGVVIITTKSGSVGRTNLEVSYEKGIQQVVRKIELMNSQEFIQFYRDARNNQYIYDNRNNPNFVPLPENQRPNNYRIPEEFLNNPGSFETTDWQDVAFRTAYSDNAYISLSGGNNKITYLLSGNFLNQEGIVDRSYYQRFTVRSNIKYQLTDHLTLASNITFAKSKDRIFGTFGKEDVASLVQQSAPIYPVIMETGTLGPLDRNSQWNKYYASPYSIQTWHPYAITRETDNQGQRLNLMSNTSLEYKFLKHFAISTSLGLRLENYRYSNYLNEGQNYGWSALNAATGVANTNQTDNWLSETTLRYANTFGYHEFSGMVAYTAQENTYQTSNQTSRSFPNDMVHTLNAGSPTASSTNAEKWRLLSYIARVNYGYKNKYLVQATIRRDGSSRFGSNNKWGYFPSASVAWRVSEEDFLKNVSSLSQLKLRLSYGVTGNNQIPNYGSWATLGTRQYAWGSTASGVARGLYPNSMPDPDLSWEKTGQYNVGINVGLFNNRVYVEADYYRSLTTDLLLNVPVPITSGFSTQLTNIGEVENKGMEFLIVTKNMTGAFRWETNFNISFNRNKVLKLGPDAAPIYVREWGAHKTEIGQPIANYWGYKFDGLFNNQAEINDYPHHASTTPGDPKVVNVSGDDKINADDQTILGNIQPKFIYGMTNNFFYKNFDLSIMLQGQYGGKIMNSQFRYNGLFNGGRNAYKDTKNYWKSESDPGDGRHFKPYSNNPGLQNQSGACTSLWIEDGTFLRIANLRLGYTFGSGILEKLHLSSLRIYMSIDNLYLFSKYTGYDPDNSTYFTNTLRSGEDYGSSPIPRTITFGIKFGL